MLRRNLGTILTEEVRPVRLADGPAVGQVDEVFADRLQPGDRFVLDGRCLEFKRAEEGGLTVEEVVGHPRVPRWVGEGWPLDADLARRLYLLRTQAAEALWDKAAAIERAKKRHDRAGGHGTAFNKTKVDKPWAKAIAEFEAVCPCGGATRARDLPIPGRELKGIHLAMEFLPLQNRRVAGDPVADDPHSTARDKHVVIIGG